TLAMTLIELLTVISIIGVLAAMIFPVIAKIKQNAKISSGKHDITKLNNAIAAYYAEYNRYPAGSNAINCAAAGALPTYDCPSFTFGTFAVANVTNLSVLNTNGAPVPEAAYQANNSEVIAILKGWTNLPNLAPSMNTFYTL